MEILKTIVKDKLFYIVLGIILVVSSAMNFNRNHNADLLEEFYQPDNNTGVSTTAVQSENKSKTENKKNKSRARAYQDSKDIRDSLVDYAMQFQGRPYQYAGKGPSVFDCSGFTCFVYKNFDIQLPASSKLQSGFGEELDVDEVKKGDLLIFKSPTPGNNDVGHVGMVVSNEDGKINFIHSSTGRGVVIDSLTHRHYQARYMGARRVIED